MDRRSAYSVDESLTYWTFPSDQSIAFIKDWRQRMVKRVCGYMPDRLLAAVGALIYRHAG